MLLVGYPGQDFPGQSGWKSCLKGTQQVLGRQLGLTSLSRVDLAALWAETDLLH